MFHWIRLTRYFAVALILCKNNNNLDYTFYKYVSWRCRFIGTEEEFRGYLPATNYNIRQIEDEVRCFISDKNIYI
jgi:hypothetical protein